MLKCCAAEYESDSETEFEEGTQWARSSSNVEQQTVTVSVRKRPVRTTKDEPVPPGEALALLKAGNDRFAKGDALMVRAPIGPKGRASLVDNGQRPSAIILGCADSRVPIDTVFDSQPGDLFILRNAGNTLTCAQGSVVGSMEYAVEHLQAKLILVLGHSKCGAIAGATKVMLERQATGGAAKAEESALEKLLAGLAPVAQETMAQLPAGADEATIAASAIKTNVTHSMASIMKFSTLITERVRSGDVEIHGGIYNLKTGKVEFLGQLLGAGAPTAAYGA